MIDEPKLAQGDAKPANNTDLNHDLVSGLTYPNLHRRIDNEATPKEPDELVPDTYKITVSGVSSYRITKHTVHAEGSTESEIP